MAQYNMTHIICYPYVRQLTCKSRVTVTLSQSIEYNIASGHQNDQEIHSNPALLQPFVGLNFQPHIK